MTNNIRRLERLTYGKLLFPLLMTAAAIVAAISLLTGPSITSGVWALVTVTWAAYLWRQYLRIRRADRRLGPPEETPSIRRAELRHKRTVHRLVLSGTVVVISMLLWVFLGSVPVVGHLLLGISAVGVAGVCLFAATIGWRYPERAGIVAVPDELEGGWGGLRNTKTLRSGSGRGSESGSDAILPGSGNGDEK